MSQVLVNFRMDEEDKKGMEEVCKELGLSMSTAFTLFAKKMRREKRIPFEIGLGHPNRETAAAMRDAVSIARDPTVKGFGSINALLQDLES